MRETLPSSSLENKLTSFNELIPTEKAWCVALYGVQRFASQPLAPGSQAFAAVLHNVLNPYSAEKIMAIANIPSDALTPALINHLQEQNGLVHDLTMFVEDKQIQEARAALRPGGSLKALEEALPMYEPLEKRSPILAKRVTDFYEKTKQLVEEHLVKPGVDSSSVAAQIAIYLNAHSSIPEDAP